MVRVVACDDGVVEKLGEGCTLVACILWDSGLGPLDASLSMVKVDGLEASSVVAYLVQRLAGSPEAVLLDSVTLAGFNIVSPSTVYKLTRVPVVVIYKYRPSFKRVERAVEEHLPSPQLRLRVLRLLDQARAVATGRGPLYTISWPPDYDPVPLIEELQLYGRIPEPLRAVHYIASSISRILSGQPVHC